MTALRQQHLPPAAAPVVIAGAGAAGLSCALAAAGHGQPVILLEQAASAGGTVSQALIHTLGGLLDDQGNLLYDGLPTALLARLSKACPYTQKRRIGKTWVVNVDPAIYTKVVSDWLAATTLIQVYYHSRIEQILHNEGRIHQVRFQTPAGSRSVALSALVDTTGHAAIVRQVDESRVQAGRALSGMIVQIRGVEANTLQFPKGVALLRDLRAASAQQQLPAECATVWLDSGVYTDEVYAKFTLQGDHQPSASWQAIGAQLLAYLQTRPGFAQAYLAAIGHTGIRDGGRIKGEYCLSETDIRSGQRFTDAACQACWPIEHWHPEQGLQLEYLPAGHTYEIPLRSLKVAGFSNLWAAGKCLSAEPRAQASARVVGTCWAMGEALGTYLAGKQL